MTAPLKARRPLTAAIITSALVMCGPTARCSSVSGDVSGDWTLVMSPVVATSDCHVPLGSTLRIRPGVQVRFAPGVSLLVDGTLTAVGGDAFPIYLVPSDAAIGPWGSVVISPTGQANLSSCFIRGGGASTTGDPTGVIRVDGPSALTPQVKLTKCEVSGSASSGVFLNGGSVASLRSSYFGNGGAQPTDAALHVVTGSVTLGLGADANNIRNGVFGVYNEDIVPIDASGQWWGAASGPQTPDNVPGIGSSVSDDVTFGNWITVDPHPSTGDVDRDGAVTVNDVAFVLRVIGGMTSVDASTLTLGDVEANRALDLRDATRLARVVAGLETLP